MKTKSIVLLFFVATYFSACKKDDPVIPNEEELITTVKLTMISQDMTDTVNFSFVDLDGDGGDEATISVGALNANTTYNASITLSNETENPAEDITAEVEEEGLEHQFFYIVTDANLTVAYDDQDTEGNPVGLKSVFTTGDASTGELKVVLRHEPTKPNTDPAIAGGETDIEVDFSIAIE